MNYATIKPVDIANGEGVRVTLFVSGCRHHCKNCFNPDQWDFSYGKEFNDKVIDEILSYMAPDYIAGLTLLGGEPFEKENQEGLLKLLKAVKQKYPNKNIWSYTGFVLDKELWGKSRASGKNADEMLKYIDVLVDGRFVEDLKNITLRFRGSSNQRIIDVPASLKKHEVVLYNLK
ncbi:MAG: anaerobic ribonucleoside-triphosphate reductase activating protein [Clostridia bacterium]|nr:anaerobic ribonucleoside-triphosphate reductase activating protein [Clostridia bacterium]